MWVYMYVTYVNLDVIESVTLFVLYIVFFFQAEDGIRDLVRSRGLGDVYKRQVAQRIGKRRNWTLDRAHDQRRRGYHELRRAAVSLSLIHI